MTENTPTKPNPSPLHTFLSLIVPGLGQLVAGYWARGFTFLATTLVLSGLSIWTIAQRARFPEYDTSVNIFFLLLLQAIILRLLLLAFQGMVSRSVLKDNATRSFAAIAFNVLYFIAIIILINPFLSLAGDPEQLKTVYEPLAVLAAGALAAFWVWQARDASTMAALDIGQKKPAIINGILLASLVIFVLGFNITGIDLNKAIIEYQDLSTILPRIFWPWRNAFEFEQIAIEVEQKIQAPCPEGAEGPPSNSPLEDATWVSATPTCGAITQRDLQGNVTVGTELTITAGGFTPGQVVDILWKNPIGNAFKPRGVGETEITVDENGELTTTLFIPEVTIAEATASGDIIHTLLLRENVEEVFTGRLSDEMRLALIGMLETIMIGLMATFFGILLAIPISFLAARNLMGPIVDPFSETVGTLLGAVGGVIGTRYLISYITTLIGGLEKAPIPIFLLVLIVLFTFVLLGTKFGRFLFKTIHTKLKPVLATAVLSVVVFFSTAFIGHLVGISISRGIVSIPLGSEAAQPFEISLSIATAIIFGIAGLVFTLRRGYEGEFKTGLMIYAVIRTLLNIVRSIEPIIWAIVAVIWIGLGPFAGTIALTLHTIAALAKLYSESIESIDPGPIEALQSTGATRLQTIIYAVVPQIMPPFISFTLYRWDINIRMSTIIGIVGGGGIGFLVIQWMRLFQYEFVGIAMWLIGITVTALDFISSDIRERFT